MNRKNETDPEFIRNLKQKIKHLNEEKLSLLNDVELQKTQITNLRTEVNYIKENKTQESNHHY